MPHPIPAAPSLRTASVLPRRRARGARRPRPPASPVCGPLAARVAGGGAGDAGGRGGARPSMHTPATALPPGLGTPLGLCASPGGTTVVGREGVSRSDWSSDRRLRRGSPAPGTESTEGPRPEGPGPGEPGRDQQPLTAPLAALADLNWPQESSPQDPPPSHPRAQTETCTLTHTHTYLHSRSCSPAHTTTHISTHAHGHKLALTHVLTCTLTDTHLHTQT